LFHIVVTNDDDLYTMFSKKITAKKSYEKCALFE